MLWVTKQINGRTDVTLPLLGLYHKLELALELTTVDSGDRQSLF